MCMHTSHSFYFGHLYTHLSNDWRCHLTKIFAQNENRIKHKIEYFLGKPNSEETYPFALGLGMHTITYYKT